MHSTVQHAYHTRLQSSERIVKVLCIVFIVLLFLLAATPARAQMPPGQVMYAWVIGQSLFVSFVDGIPPGAPLYTAFPSTGCKATGATSDLHCVRALQGSTIVAETFGDGNIPMGSYVPGRLFGPYNMGFCTGHDMRCPPGHMWSYVAAVLKGATAGQPITVIYDGKVVATIAR